jgi:hypothetical protein
MYVPLTKSLFKSAGITVSHFFSMLSSTLKYLYSVEPVRMHFPVQIILCTLLHSSIAHSIICRLRLKCDGTRAETRFCISAKRTSPFKSARGGGGSVQSTTGRRAIHISLQGLYCSCEPVFCSHVTLTGYPLNCLVSISLLRSCVTVCHHISNAVYTAVSRENAF